MGIANFAFCKADCYPLFMKKKVVNKTEKHVTSSRFERAMTSIAQSFNRINEYLERHDGMFEMLIKEMAEMRKEHKEYRQEMHSLYGSYVRFEKDLSGLDERVLKLELKTK